MCVTISTIPLKCSLNYEQIVNWQQNAVKRRTLKCTKVERPFKMVRSVHVAQPTPTKMGCTTLNVTIVLSALNHELFFYLHELANEPRKGSERIGASAGRLPARCMVAAEDLQRPQHHQRHETNSRVFLVFAFARYCTLSCFVFHATVIKSCCWWPMCRTVLFCKYCVGFLVKAQKHGTRNCASGEGWRTIVGAWIAVSFVARRCLSTYVNTHVSVC